MLSALRIRNLALVEDLSWSLDRGYTAITGETGAGKSIILGALKLLIGERADKSLIRSGADACTVEATFTLANADQWNVRLEALGVEPCEDSHLLLKRTFTTAGTNRQFINNSATTLATLKILGDDLVDLHGPHDHQSLFSAARQSDILDQFAGSTDLLAEYRSLFQRAGDLREEHRTLATSEAALAQELDLLQFQKNEIESADLDPAEAADTLARYSTISQARRLTELTASLRDRLSENDDSAATRHAEAQRIFRELERLDPTTHELATRHTTLIAELDDISDALGKYLDALDLDPEQIQHLEDRVNLLQNLQRKYGPTVEEVIAFGIKVSERLTKITGRDAELARLTDELKKTEAALLTIGGRLTKLRQKVIAPLAKDVTLHLRDLGFKQAHFEITLLPFDLPKPQGLEGIEFQFAPNPGEPIQPLRAIASSGEISRVMLAIKSALASHDEIALLVFDEIDANVGGEIAHAVGEKMRSLGEHHQVLSITHLPQVAAQARDHFVVSKEVDKGRTFSRLTRVADEERVAEIARMLGGKSSSALAHAKTLLEKR